MSLQSKVLNRSLLSAKNTILNLERNLWVVKRQREVQLPKEDKLPTIRPRNYIYDDIVKTESTRRPDVQLILTDLVEGLGKKGDLITVRPHIARDRLLPQGSAVYASPENLKKFGISERALESLNEQQSKLTSAKTRKQLSQEILALTMNRDNPWTIEKYHVKACLRKFGFWVPEECIEMPEKEISGPDMELQGKVFIATITFQLLWTWPALRLPFTYQKRFDPAWK
ncbi:large ribosomal subunit protein bL9m-like isoform X2 [Artemia franciscana]|uniref:large ribosomal subunit protein bL9m-like isoform X2 n=1 Tax=Artemia franciscana TaxID=6661 RepID=UPI0032DAAA1A